MDLRATDDVFNFTESESIRGNVLANDGVGLDTKLYLRAFDGLSVAAKKADQVTDVVGTYGTFHVKADGTFEYTLSDAAKKGLYAGTTLTESLNYKISNGAGGTDMASFKLNIAGETVKFVALDDSFTQTEGTKKVHDVLANDIAGETGELFLRSVGSTAIGAKQGPGQITDVKGTYGTFHFSPDGKFTYDLDETVAKSLNTGQSVTEKLEYYKISDGAGHTDVGTITLKIDGVTDAQPKTALLFDFEDRPAGNNDLPADYHGFKFQTATLSTSTLDDQYHKGSGYEYGSVGDGNIVAFTPYGYLPTKISQVSGDNFDFDSVYLTSAWAEKQSVTLNGYDDHGNVAHTITVDVTNTAPTFVDVDWKDIDVLEIVQGTQAHLVIDNLSLFV